MPNKQQTARQELARRELARRDLLRFGQYMQEGFRVYPHQRAISDALLRLMEYVETRGKSGVGRLIIETQPQVGKSLVASVLFTSWALGKHPEWKFILTSYNASRAEGNSKAVRDMVSHPRYRAVFGALAGEEEPVKLSSDSRSVSEWALAAPHQGGVFAAGVGGGITGHPAQIIIIDDPFKGRDEANSQGERDKVADWYETQVYTRQQEGTAIILFHTRWHQDDLAGRLIRSMVTTPKADQWEVLCMPALALSAADYPADVDAQRKLMQDGVFVPLADPLGRQPGEALCPEMLSRERLESIRENMDLYNWESLYQQQPFLRAGGKFKRPWFVVSDKLPDFAKVSKILWYWDQAGKEDQGDYSVGVLMALDDAGCIWVLDVVRGQWSTYERRRRMKEIYLADRTRFKTTIVPQLWHPQDPGSAGLDSARDTNKALAGLPAHFETVSGDKETRADPWSSALEADNVRLVRAAWNKAFVDEHLSFPKGRNDDQVDAASSAYNKLMVDAEPGMVSWARKQLELMKQAEEQQAELMKQAEETQQKEPTNGPTNQN